MTLFEIVFLPSWRIIVDTPWKNPLNWGFPLRWSLMNFTLTVSIGVTANMASHTPAPRPANNFPPAVNWPLWSCICFLNVSNEPNLMRGKEKHWISIKKIVSLVRAEKVWAEYDENIYRTADLGMLPYNNTDRPRYNPRTPFAFTVFFTQSLIPLYFLAPPE